MLKALTRLFGSRNERLVKSYGRAVRASAALEAQISALSNDEMRAKTFEFRTRLERPARRWRICSPRLSPWCARRRSGC